MLNKKTYINKNGLPIIRRCSNCKFWDEFEKKNDDEKFKSGYCKLIKLYFSSTLENTVFAITKSYYLCEKHMFNNEEFLIQNSKQIDLIDIIEKK